jgi:conjugative transfer region protein TrbK
MDITNQDRLAALIVLVSALLATAMALSSHNESSTNPGDTERAVAATTALDIDLARCKALGSEAGNDAACQAAWRIIRKRSFEYEESRHGLTVNPESSREVGASRPRGEVTGAPQSLSRPNPDSPRSSANGERPQ